MQYEYAVHITSHDNVGNANPTGTIFRGDDFYDIVNKAVEHIKAYLSIRKEELGSADFGAIYGATFFNERELRYYTNLDTVKEGYFSIDLLPILTIDEPSFEGLEIADPLNNKDDE